MKQKIQAILLFCTVIILSAGCTVSLDVAAGKNGEASVSVASEMGPALEKTVRSVSGLKDGQPLFDPLELKEQLTSEGLTGVTASVRGNTALSVHAAVKDLSEGISAVPGAVVYRTEKDGSHTLSFTLTVQNIQKAASMLPETEHSYIDLLMAPVFTGDTMTKDEYLELAASVYGQPIADEIGTSMLSIKLHTPSGKQKAVSIPLTDLLILSGSSRISVSVTW